MVQHDIWIEKYRPQTFDQIKGQKPIIEKIRAFVESNSMPHLLFSGPAGVGKTTTAIVIAKTIYGSTWQNSILELNASDERGIDVIRTKVKDFARTKAIEDVPFKIIYLDECDALTKDAQQALRRTMENFSKTCRFVLSCNYVSKLIDPIQSRCTIFKFQPLKNDEINDVIEGICVKENVQISDESKAALFEVSHGDARKLENIMQAVASVDKAFTTETIFSMANIAKPQEISKLLDLAQKGEFIDARKLLLDVMLQQGLSGIDIIKQIQKEILKLDIDKKLMLKTIDKCAETEFRINEGSDEYIQLEALLAYIGYSNQ